MARAKRHYIPGYVWHITHRCHKREFLFKFPRDRRRWIAWLFQAKKRYRGLSVLNYDDLKNAHYKWVDSAISSANNGKESKWTQSIAVGSKTFIEKMKKALGHKTKGRKIISADDTFELREAVTPFGCQQQLATLTIGGQKARIYDDVDCDCGMRRKKRDISIYVVGYQGSVCTFCQGEDSHCPGILESRSYTRDMREQTKGVMLKI